MRKRLENLFLKTICIDFETANAARASACSVGIAVITDDVITFTTEQLIKPPPACARFDPFNVAIHGIHETDVADAPEFGDLAPRLMPLLTGNLLVAHNAAFDLSVLRALCDTYGLPYPTCKYLCSCKTAARLWPQLENHKLNTLCDFIGHRFHHHNAAADAEAAAHLLLAMQRECAAATPLELAMRLEVRPGSLFPGGYTPCSTRRSSTTCRRKMH